MDRQLLVRLSPLLDQAQGLSGEALATWLDAQALSDTDRAMLLRWLAEPPSELTSAPAAPPELTPGEWIGRWRLVRELGSGGMGVVWLAQGPGEPTEHPEHVALKIPHAGPGHRLLAQRLQRERGILSALSHPNIARLIDTCLTPQGLPCLVLEFVAGDTLLRHAQQQALDTTARLHLMLQVLDAVQHAHGQLVLHRDLKPANILVTPDGQVKLLDFGIAKLLSGTVAQATELTQQGGHVLTPDYAAPEQIRGEPLGVASDLYSLGAILYELLTGERPYRLPHGHRGELEQAILHADPEPPSQRWAKGDASQLARARQHGESHPRKLALALRGDLDTIVLKALSKSATRRYPTADAMAQDIRLHLQGQAIRAQADSPWERTRRFVRRHTVLLLSTGAVMVALSVGLGLALWQAQQARMEAAKATAIKDFLIGLFQANDIERDDSLRKRQQSVQSLLEDSARALRGPALEGQPGTQAELQAVVGQLLHDLHINDEALALRQHRLNVLQQQGAPAAQRVPAWRELADSHDAQGQLSPMRDALEQGLALCRSNGMSPLADCHGIQVLLGRLDLVEERMADARRRIEASASVLRTQLPDDEKTAEALIALGELRDHEGKATEALGLYEASLALRERLWPANSPKLATLRYEQALNLWALGQYGPAEAQLQRTHDALVKALGPAHPAVLPVAQHWHRLRLQMDLNEVDWQAVHRLSERIVSSPDIVDPTLQLWARTTRLEAALLTGRLNDAQAALQALDAALPGLAVPDERLLEIARLRAWFHHDSGQYALAQRDMLEAMDTARRSQAAPQVLADLRSRWQISRVAAGEHAAIAPADALAPDLSLHARWAWLMAQGRVNDALALATQMPAQGLWPQRMGRHLRLGETLARLGRHAEARQAFDAGLDMLKGRYAASVHGAALRLQCAPTLDALKLPAQAAEQRRRAQQALATETLAGPHLRRGVSP